MHGFFIWFEQRSGSSFLASLLNSNPQINCRGEMFGCVPIDQDSGETRSKAGELDPRTFRDRTYSRVLNRFPGRQLAPSDSETEIELAQWLQQSTPEKIHGFKLKHPSQHGVFPEVATALLQRADSIRVIVLRRKNFLRRAISLMNMQRIQQAQQSANVREDVELPPLNVNVSEVIRLTRYYEQSQAPFDEFSAQFSNVLDIEYGDLINNTQQICKSLQKFLGVTPISTLRAGTKQITPTDLEDAISNFAELKTALEKQSLGHFLYQR